MHQQYDVSRPTDAQAQALEPDLNLGTRIDRNGKTTYHLLSSDRRIGVFLEKVYNQEHQLIRLQKRGRGSNSDTFYDTKSGAVERVFETSTLPDGSSLTKNLTYSSNDRSSEDVIVIAPNGQVVRRVEREHIGLRTIYQGQTEYNQDGTPANTVNHRLDAVTGRLSQREQIQWVGGSGEQQRALTESFHFDSTGSLVKYVKVIYSANSGPFLEENNEYDSTDQSLLKRVVTGYNRSGKPSSVDTVTYNRDGDVTSHSSIFYDDFGNCFIKRQNLASQ